MVEKFFALLSFPWIVFFACCVYLCHELKCLLPERYLVVRKMWLDDGGYCDWARQYGDSSKFWWEWWGADCYSITWWRRFLRLHIILVEGGVPLWSRWKDDTEWIMNCSDLHGIHSGGSESISGFSPSLLAFFGVNCCVFIKLLKGNISNLSSGSTHLHYGADQALQAKQILKQKGRNNDKKWKYAKSESFVRENPGTRRLENFHLTSSPSGTTATHWWGEHCE